MKVTINENGKTKEVDVQSGTLISDIIELGDVHIDYPCGKNGVCKKCLVKVKGGVSAPSKDELVLGDKLDLGYRLACRSKVLGDCEIEILKENSKLQTSENVINADKLDIKPMFKNAGLAIDIGTTTLAVSLILSDNKVFNTTVKNPQSEFGADVISRIEKSMNGEKAELSRSIINGINQVISQLCGEANINNNDIDSAVITGNTTMLHLLTQTDCTPLSKAPFEAEYLADEYISSEKLGIHINGDIYLPSCFCAFVGADITTAIVASGMMNSEKTSILVDIGTNGEMALWHNGKLCCCSTAAGPAFEGVGVRCGIHGISGAIDHVSVENGELIVSTIGDEKAKGICGSGVVDAVASMLEIGVLDDSGLIDDENTDYENRIIDDNDDIMFELSNNIGVYGKDIRAIQLAKSAICSGLITLIQESNLTYQDIDTLYIAGGFGSFLDIIKTGEIGLIPNELVSKVKVIGNAALTGTQMLLLNKNLIKTTQKITKEFSHVDLSTSKTFMDNYIENMFFET